MNLVNPYRFGFNLLSNLVAYYALDNNANDSLGLHNGTVNGAVSFVTGKNNQCASFSSTTSITAPDSDDFSFSNGSNDIPFSISTWINFSSLTGTQFIISKWDIGNHNEWLCAWNSTFLTIVTSVPNTSSFIRANYTFTPTLNTWYHVVFTYDGSELNSGLKIYVNGALASSVNSGTYTGMTSSITPLKIGNSDFNEFFKNKIDEIGIWKNRKLTDAEVSYLYNSGAGKFYPF